MNHWQVLAFDVRVPIARANFDLLAGYRQHALLNLNVASALSVDETIWSQIEHDRLEEFVEHAAAVMRPPCNPQSLLDSNALLSRIPDQWLTDRPDVLRGDDWLIALSISPATSTYLSSLKSKGLLFSPVIDAVLLEQRNWKLLGFDVADKTLYSPLMNGDLGEPVRESLAKPFRDKVNDYGLFVAVDTAERFAKIAADYIPEHAPYYAVGILAHPSNG